MNRAIRPSLLVIVVSAVLVGYGPPPPVPQQTHIQQVRQAIAKGGGMANILVESRTLFARLCQEKGPALHVTEEQCFQGLSGIANLGDVLDYSSHEPDRIHVRIHNSHFDIIGGWLPPLT